MTWVTSIARLHGEACIVCGSANYPLLPVGRLPLKGSRVAWQVVACREHRVRARSLVKPQSALPVGRRGKSDDGTGAE